MDTGSPGTDIHREPLDTARPADAGSSGAGRDTAVPVDPGDAPPSPPYPLVSLSPIDGGLWAIAPDTGEATRLCTVELLASYTALAFDAQRRLVAFDNDNNRLLEIDPCSCAVEVRGTPKIGFAPGLASVPDIGFIAVEAGLDLLVRLPDLGAAVPIGPLELDVTGGGLGWSVSEQKLLLLDANSSAVYQLDVKSGAAILVLELDGISGGGGFEIHPQTHAWYLCDVSGTVTAVDRETGALSPVSALPGSPCANLAAAPYAVTCEAVGQVKP